MLLEQFRIPQKLKINMLGFDVVYALANVKCASICAEGQTRFGAMLVRQSSYLCRRCFVHSGVDADAQRKRLQEHQQFARALRFANLAWDGFLTKAGQCFAGASSSLYLA